MGGAGYNFMGLHFSVSCTTVEVTLSPLKSLSPCQRSWHPRYVYFLCLYLSAVYYTMVVYMRIDCRRLRCLTIWSLVLFGKVIEFIGYWALLEKLCHWKWALRVCSLAVHILFPLFAESVFSQFPALAVCCSACSFVTVYGYWRSVSDVEGDQETSDHSARSRWKRLYSVHISVVEELLWGPKFSKTVAWWNSKAGVWIFSLE